ncbi:hypothetical protein [Lacticaseibacillus thailandensis]|nr:hypothetical protein [Lacticaseibacillus thailandensis]
MPEHIYGLVVIESQGVGFSVTNLQQLHKLDRGFYPVAIGSDSFSDNVLSVETADALETALNTVVRLFKDYGVVDYGGFAGNVFFEASNAEFVRDQLYNRTGVWLQQLAVSEETYHRANAVMQYFPHFDQLAREGTLLIDIGGGTVELLAFQNGQFCFARNLPLGPIRVVEELKQVQRTETNYVAVLRDYIDSKLMNFIRLVPDPHTYQHLIIMGTGQHLLSKLLPAGTANQEVLSALQQAYQVVVPASDQLLAERYGLNSAELDQVLPTVLLVHELVANLRIQHVWTSSIDLLDGLAVNAAINADSRAIKFDHTSIIRASATWLSDWYRVDQPHRDAVTKMALQLFNRLKSLHGLGKRERVLLETAALLADVGTYIDEQDVGSNNEYLIRATDVIGLSIHEQRMVALITHIYTSHKPGVYLSMDNGLRRAERVAAAKLASLLRMADALDASRRQKVQQLRVSLRGGRLGITVTSQDNVDLERWSFTSRSQFFESVFGIPVDFKWRNVQ